MGSTAQRMVTDWRLARQPFNLFLCGVVLLFILTMSLKLPIFAWLGIISLVILPIPLFTRLRDAGFDKGSLIATGVISIIIGAGLIGLMLVLAAGAAIGGAPGSGGGTGKFYPILLSAFLFTLTALSLYGALAPTKHLNPTEVPS